MLEVVARVIFDSKVFAYWKNQSSMLKIQPEKLWIPMGCAEKKQADINHLDRKKNVMSRDRSAETYGAIPIYMNLHPDKMVECKVRCM